MYIKQKTLGNSIIASSILFIVLLIIWAVLWYLKMDSDSLLPVMILPVALWFMSLNAAVVMILKNKEEINFKNKIFNLKSVVSIASVICLFLLLTTWSLFASDNHNVYLENALGITILIWFIAVNIVICRIYLILKKEEWDGDTKLQQTNRRKNLCATSLICCLIFIITAFILLFTSNEFIYLVLALSFVVWIITSNWLLRNILVKKESWYNTDLCLWELEYKKY